MVIEPPLVVLGTPPDGSRATPGVPGLHLMVLGPPLVVPGTPPDGFWATPDGS